MSTTAPSLTLRPYQEAAVQMALDALEHGEHPVLALPTGAGKSLVIAALIERLPDRILVATHRQELLEQDESQLARLSDEPTAGVYSAGLARREADARVVFGGVQSIYRKMSVLQRAGPFRYIVVDEAHRVPPPSVASMYGAVFDACPDAQRLGLTATPYRSDDGLLHEGDDTWFTSMPVELGIRALTPQWLAPLAGVLSAHNIDVSQVRTRAGEFVTRDLSQAACEERVVQGAIEELCQLGQQRQHWLLFCVDVAHSRLVHEALEARGIASDLLLGTTPQDERHALLQRFRSGQTRALVNCEVATTGFDIPHIDCIALLRPTQSKSLCVQMLGRGTRQAPHKVDCLVVDFAGNLDRHTPLDDLSTLTQSPARADQERAEAEDRVRKARAAAHGRTPSLADPMAGRNEPVVYRVHRMQVARVEAKKYPGRFMIRLGYLCPDRPGQRWVSQYLCPEHPGFAPRYARAWFERRDLPVPQSAAEALHILDDAPMPQRIVVDEADEWPRVVMEQFDEAVPARRMEQVHPGIRVRLGSRQHV